MVAPAYMLAFRIFDDSGLHRKLRAVPEDDQGIDIEFLTRELKKRDKEEKPEENSTPVTSIQSSPVFARLTPISEFQA